MTPIARRGKVVGDEEVPLEVPGLSVLGGLRYDQNGWDWDDVSRNRR